MLGLGPIGEMATRVAQHHGARVLAVDLVPERLERARGHGVDALDLDAHTGELPAAVRELTDGRGPASVIDAVGMEAHGAPVAELAHKLTGLPARPRSPHGDGEGRDRPPQRPAHRDRARPTRRHDLLSGVYGGAASPMPLIQMFDKQINLRMGQANVRRWIRPTSCPCSPVPGDPLGVDDFATHHVPLDDAPQAYEIFQKKEDNAFKILLEPGS